MPQIVLLVLTPARDWRFLLLPEHTEACAGSWSWGPHSALNHVLCSLAGAAILGKQIFVNFNKSFSLLIHPVHFLIKIQTLTLSGTPNITDIWTKAMLSYSNSYTPSLPAFLFIPSWHCPLTMLVKRYLWKNHSSLLPPLSLLFHSIPMTKPLLIIEKASKL